MLKKTVVTIGTFDGVHLGHQKILNRVVALSQTLGLTPTVLTLFPHPRMVLGDQDIKLLNTIDERISILKSYGIKTVIVKEFTPNFANLSAEDYIKTVLVEQLNAKKIVIGYDHKFGHNRSADITDLKNYGTKYGFEVEEISAKDIEDVTISSTKIRTALFNGNIKTANTYLSYIYSFTGVVVKGKGLGKTIGFPTANIRVNATYKLIPASGVYVISSTINKVSCFGMMNIGTNPTVGGTTQSIEVHFFNFNTDLYNTTITINIIRRLRNEVKFDSLDGLKTQLQKDKTNALHSIRG